MAFFLPKKDKAKMCNVHERYMYVQPGQKITALFLKYLAYFSYGLYFGFVSISFLGAVQNADT